MAFSIAGWVNAFCSVTNSCTSFALSSARVLATLSSNALFTALAWMFASFSSAANCVLATARSTSTLALLAAWICSGVTYIFLAPGLSFVQCSKSDSRPIVLEGQEVIGVSHNRELVLAYAEAVSFPIAGSRHAPDMLSALRVTER